VTSTASQFDHLFICTAIGAPEAERLAGFGLIEGTPNTHPGQGTACRRFFFRNAYLELLWVHDAIEAQSSPAGPTRLWKRWSGRSGVACPFGFGFRPGAQPDAKPPCSTWDYHPSYLPPSLRIAVAANSEVLTEPMLFYLGFAQRPDSFPAGKRQPMAHACGMREITRVEFVSPHADKFSPELMAVRDANLVRLCAGTEYLVEVGFDGELQGSTKDFRPELPLRFRW